MRIGEASKQSGCHIETIRYYERIGLLPSPPRSESGYRHYDEQHVKQLRFIHRARELGFSLEEIRELLSLKEQPDLACDAVDQMTRKHLQAIQHRIASLTALADELRRIAARCAGGHIADCRILEAMDPPRSDA